jgi:precorrin-6B C5,15-methyltransferase / cobalt-precorrin-6B C5,C15-methyltransferase
VQAACARLKLPWHDAAVVSLHGRTWDRLEAAVGRSDQIIIYTDPEHTPAAIARFLQGHGLGLARLCVLEDLGQATERFTWLSPAEAASREFSPLNMVVVLNEPSMFQGNTQNHENVMVAAGYSLRCTAETPVPPRALSEQGAGSRSRLHLGLPEEVLAHQRGLITKAELRAVVLAQLRLHPGMTLWDLGAGCGSVGLEASLLTPGGRILAVEQDGERAAQIRANRDKFGVDHLEVVCGRAPECLAALPAPDRVFIGGGGQDVGVILGEVLRRLPASGRVVLTAALLETLETARQVLEAAGWETEVTQLQVSRSRPLSGGDYLQALNPVWIVAGWRGSNHD